MISPEVLITFKACEKPDWYTELRAISHRSHELNFHSCNNKSKETVRVLKLKSWKAGKQQIMLTHRSSYTVFFHQGLFC